ncbi:MAG: penicillin-binding protein 2 [Thermoleophilum sp.]|mgnify:FL=1|nr:penicillin-binding protein 2 [Thermoleophilum sp.]
MNARIRTLFSATVLLFALLALFTTRWSVLEASRLRDEPSNRRSLIEEAQNPRGMIFARDGTVLARSVRRGTGSGVRYERVYPLGGLFAHAVGYSFIERGRAGIERSRNDWLSGRHEGIDTLLAPFEGRASRPDDVVTTLDPRAQRAAYDGLAGRAGAVVALDPRDGSVLVMASSPTYDPNAIATRDPARLPAAPELNRATQGRYPPGSTMKVVTAAAALDTGEFTPDSVLDGDSPRLVGGAPLANFGNQSFGPISLTDALTNSVNTVFAQIGERLGKRTLFRYMDRFGFGRDPRLDYPDDQMAPSGVYAGQRLLGPDDPLDIGRVAIGQERLQVTPLQMALVAAAVANGGLLVRPHLTDRIVDPSGRVVERVGRDVETRVMSPTTAGQLTEMMSRVVEEGSGTAAALAGVRVAGKTGTAEVAGGTANQAWFIGFAPVDSPRVAVAVTVERTQGQGGTVAAPIARTVLETLLGTR